MNILDNNYDFNKIEIQVPVGIGDGNHFCKLEYDNIYNNSYSNRNIYATISSSDNIKHEIYLPRDKSFSAENNKIIINLEDNTDNPSIIVKHSHNDDYKFHFTIQT